MQSAVTDRTQTASRLAACEGDIRALGVVRLALFGSVLRGQTHDGSDVDFLVQFAPGTKTYGRFLALSELLEARLGRHVELVTTEALSPSSAPGFWRKRKMSFEPRDYLRHILVEADYLIERSADLSYETFAAAYSLIASPSKPTSWSNA